MWWSDTPQFMQMICYLKFSQSKIQVWQNVMNMVESLENFRPAGLVGSLFEPLFVGEGGGEDYL